MAVSAKSVRKLSFGRRIKLFFGRFRITTPKAYFRVKICCALAVPLLYFLYSPLLILPMLIFIALFCFAPGVEREINRNVIRRNRIRLIKTDSLLALIVVAIAIAGTIVDANSKVRPGGFANMSDDTVTEFIENSEFAAARRRSAWVGFVRKVSDFGSLLTGRRSVFSGVRRFAAADPPENFTPPENFSPPGGMPDLGDLPFDYVISSVLSSVNTVLVFGTAVCGVLSLVCYRRRKKFTERLVSQVIPDCSMAAFTDEQLEKILSFGISTEPPDDSAQTIESGLDGRSEQTTESGLDSRSEQTTESGLDGRSEQTTESGLDGRSEQTPDGK